ncbi:MAG: hypothetical protein WBG39_04885, partial [Gordonia sp. (in: high G+C Gram-positive bacteria)]
MLADLAALAACMPGSDTAAAANIASDLANRQQREVAEYYSAMAQAVWTNAGVYEVEDSELAGASAQVFSIVAPATGQTLPASLCSPAPGWTL